MEKRKYDVATIFDACVDLIVHLGNVTPDFGQKEQLVQDFGVYLGGSACIFASQCAKLGLSTAGAGLAGEDAFGKIVLDELRGSGVDISYLKTSSACKTSVGVALNKGNDRCTLTYSDSIRLVEKSMVPDGLLRQSRHLHIASYYLLSGLRQDLCEILKQAKQYGLTISLDTNWDPEERWELPEELLQYVDILLPNEQELLFLSGEKSLSRAIARFLSAVPLIVVKMGAQGAAAATKDGMECIQAPAVPIADTIGAGDSFDAGFLYGYLHGRPLREYLGYAVECGSANVSAFGGCGGQLDLSRLLAKTKSQDKGELKA